MRIVVAGGTGTVGRHVGRIAEQRGHDVVPLSRGSGHDLVSGAGLDEALSGASAVIDVANIVSLSAKRSVAFFSAVTRNLLAAEARTGVGHHVALSIVGIDAIDVGYFAGKLAQERMLATGGVPYSLLRATQFHGFAGQVVPRGRLGPLVMVPAAPIRPVAEFEVAAALVSAVEAGPQGRLPDLAGPRDEQLVDMVRRLLRAEGSRLRPVEVSLPGAYWRGTGSGALRGGADAARGAITFDEWLNERTRSAASR
jgi:uncharacterized protein YbjT (DUF2867 family)